MTLQETYITETASHKQADKADMQMYFSFLKKNVQPVKKKLLTLQDSSEVVSKITYTNTFQPALMLSSLMCC